jgi:hypothetical protein
MGDACTLAVSKRSAFSPHPIPRKLSLAAGSGVPSADRPTATDWRKFLSHCKAEGPAVDFRAAVRASAVVRCHGALLPQPTTVLTRQRLAFPRVLVLRKEKMCPQPHGTPPGSSSVLVTLLGAAANDAWGRATS